MALTTLITAEILAGLPDALILDVRHDLMHPDLGEAQYRQGHIPGAIHVHLDNVLSGKKTGRNGRHPLPEPEALSSWLRSKGLSQGRQVVVYDAAGGAFAARAWWLLRWLGHDAVAVLDGGLQAWQQSHALVTDETVVVEGNFVRQPALVETVSVDDVLKNLVDQSFLVVDARAANRYAGRDETIDPRGGHIPGAVNHPFATNLTAEGKFKSPAELQSGFQQVLGDWPVSDVVVQCGSGVTACHNVLALEVAGLPGARLYPGSWSEWCSDEKRPVATGEQP